MDSSGDGRVGFAEFNAWWMQNHDKNKYQLRDSKAAFDKFDVSGDGELDADELRMLLDDLGMKDVTPEDIEDLMGELDTDGDGVVVAQAIAGKEKKLSVAERRALKKGGDSADDFSLTEAKDNKKLTSAERKAAKAAALAAKGPIKDAYHVRKH